MQYQTLSHHSLLLCNPASIYHTVTEDSHILSWEGMMGLVPWYGCICFYFCISSISATTLTYYDVQYQHITLCELCEPSQLLTPNAQFMLSLYCLQCPLFGDMPKGRGCDRKRQAKEDWIRAVALLRL